MSLTRARVLIALPCVLLATGCAPSVVPDALLTPAPCPAFPDTGSDRALGAYILQLDNCARTRGDQITAIRDIVK